VGAANDTAAVAVLAIVRQFPRCRTMTDRPSADRPPHDESPPDAPSAGRDQVVARALAARAPLRSLLGPDTPAAPAGVHHALAVSLDTLVRGLSAADLGAATRFGRPVHDVVAHLLGQLERAALVLRDDGPPETAPYDHWQVTLATIERHRRTDGNGLADALAAVHGRFVDALATAPGTATDLTSPLGWGVAKTFETWMHADDVRLALHQPVHVPDAGALDVLCALAVAAVPVTMEAAGLARPGRTARVVLLGPGGGVHHVALAPGGTASAVADVTLVADGHTFCRLFHQQVAVADAAVDVEGDASLAAEVLAAVGVLAERT
jgi:uncharacterized protein (TIGR03083 family)